jgi:hypothetical protein
MRFRTCVGTLMLASLLTACGNRTSGGFHPSGHAPAGGPGTTSSTSGASSAGGTPGAAPTAKTPQSALAAYRNYQRVYEQVYETGDPSLLSTVAMDPQLSLVTKDLADVQAQGVIWRFHNVLNPKVQGRSADDSTVVVLDCVQTLGAYRFSAKTGKRLSAWRGGAFLYQAIMKFDNGSWKISDGRQGNKC